MTPAPAPIVAVIGGGQLARMMAEPAAALGIPLRLLAEAPGVSAAQVIPDHVVGDYTDLATLREVTAGCEVVTFDHEHVPTDHLHALESDLAVRPGPDALVHAQDKGGDAGAGSPSSACRARRNALVSSVADVEDVRLPLRPEDHPRRVRRQGGVVRRRTRGLRGRLRVRRHHPRRGAGRLPPRALRPGGPFAFRPGRRVAGGRLHAAQRHLPRGDRPRTRPRPRARGAGAADRHEDRR